MAEENFPLKWDTLLSISSEDMFFFASGRCFNDAFINRNIELAIEFLNPKIRLSNCKYFTFNQDIMSRSDQPRIPVECFPENERKLDNSEKMVKNDWPSFAYRSVTNRIPRFRLTNSFMGAKNATGYNSARSFLFLSPTRETANQWQARTLAARRSVGRRR